MKFKRFIEHSLSAGNTNIIFSFLSAVQIYPCDSKPCLNGATCNNDPKDISKYKCKCAAWFTGTNCEGKKNRDPRLLCLNEILILIRDCIAYAT